MNKNMQTKQTKNLSYKLQERNEQKYANKTNKKPIIQAPRKK